MNKQNPLVVILLCCVLGLHAQNKDFDWSVGLHASIMSYSAVLEKKLTNPYEYSIGGYVSFSRYLNNNFDVSIEGSKVNLRYPVGGSPDGSQFKYEYSDLYDASFTLKYKLDNGYILRENHVISPFIKIGAGAAQAELSSGLEYFFPVGLGVNLRLGKRTSLSLQSTLKYSNLINRTYAHQSLGLLVHFGKASHKRVMATRLRERTQRYARIKKYRSKQRKLKTARAKEKLARLGTKENTTERIIISSSEKEDEDLLVSAEQKVTKEKTINRSVRSNDAEEGINVDANKPKTALTQSAAKSLNRIVEQPYIPTPPKHKTVEPVFVAIGEVKPPMPKPNDKEIATGSALADILEDNVDVTNDVMPPKVQPTEENQEFCKHSEKVLSSWGESITFESNRAGLRSKTYKPLNQVAAILKRCEGQDYVIIAHSDGDGNLGYNRKLSAKRASAVKKYLVQKGINPHRLITAAYGESLPVVPNTTEENKEKNRRIEFKLNRTSEDVTVGNR